MKRVVQCLGCNKIVRLYGSLAVRLEERQKNPLTGEVKEVEVRGKICRACARDAGYKVDRFIFKDKGKVNES